MGRSRSGTGPTPATAALDRAGIAYTVHPYEHAADERHFGAEAAARLGVDPRAIFKTLIVDTPDGLAVAVVPVAGQLDLKATAAALDVKRATMADPRTAARSSGYVIGGISPFGQRTALPTLLDSTAAEQEQIMVSAGRRGLQVRLSPADLLTVTNGRLAAVAR